MSDLTRTTTTLLDGLLDPRNMEAWRVFESRYRPLVIAYARRRGLQHADAEDLSQIVLGDFVKAYSSGQYDRQLGRLRHWLGGLATRRIADWFRQRGREVQPVDGDSQTPLLDRVPAQDDSNQLWEEEWERYLLAHCKEQIYKEFSAEYKQVFEESLVI